MEIFTRDSVADYMQDHSFGSFNIKSVERVVELLNGPDAASYLEELKMKNGKMPEKERVDNERYQFKYISTDPHTPDQNEDVGRLPDTCHHCGQPKSEHRGKGALRTLNLGDNSLTAEGALYIAKALEGNVS